MDYSGVGKRVASGVKSANKTMTGENEGGENSSSKAGRKVGSAVRKGIRIGIGKLRGNKNRPKTVGGSSGGKQLAL